MGLPPRAATSDVDSPRRPSRWVRRLAWIAATLLVAVAALHFVHAVRAIGAQPFADFPIFLRQAEVARETGRLYDHLDDLSHYAAGAAIYKYPPLYALLLLPFAQLDAAVVAGWHYWVQLALYFAAAWLLIAGERRERSLLFGIAALVALLTCGPFFETLHGLQIETPILLLLVLAMAASVRGRDGLAGAAIGVCAMLKVYPAFLIVLFLIARRWRAVIGFVVAIVLLQVMNLVVFGVEPNRAYFGTVLPYLMRELPAATVENASLARAFIAHTALDPATAKRCGQGVALALVAVTTWLTVRRRRLAPNRPPDGVEWAAFVALMLLCMPNSWLNYQLLLLLPIVVLYRHSTRAGAHRWPLLPATIATLLIAISPDDITLRGHSATITSLLFGVVDARVVATLAAWAGTTALLGKPASV